MGADLANGLRAAFRVGAAARRHLQPSSTGNDDALGAVIDYLETKRTLGAFLQRVTTGGATIAYQGSGSPEGVVTVPASTVGVYWRENATSAAATLYVRPAGSAGNTGWTALGQKGDPGVATGSRRGVALAAAGLLDENFSLELLTAQTFPTPGTVYGALVGLQAGDVVSRINVGVATAGVGTAPTLVKVGLVDPAGNVVAQSANEAGNASLTSTGVAQLPLASPYTVPTQGGHRLLFLQSGTWGTTQMQLARAGNLVATNLAAPLAGGVRRASTNGTGQTDLPANGSPTAANGAAIANQLYWMSAS